MTDQIELDDDELEGPNLPTPEAADFLNLSQSFLNKARCKGGGPVFLKFGRKVIYPMGGLKRYKRRQMRRSTSDVGGEHR